MASMTPPSSSDNDGCCNECQRANPQRHFPLILDSTPLDKLLLRQSAVTAHTTNLKLFRRFEDDPNIQSIAVIEQGRPIGLINRHHLNANLARLYHHELYDHRSCTIFMDPDPLIVDRQLPI